MTTSPDSAAKTTPAPRKKRRLLPKLLLGLALLILLLVIFAPMIIASPLGRPILLGQVNQRIAGNLNLDGLSLGWFSGAGAQNVTLKDPTGNLVARVPSLQTNLSLWNLLTGSPYNVGTLTLRCDQVNLVSYEDGTSNLSRALASQSPAPPKPAAEKPASAPAIVRATIDAQVNTLTATAPNAPPLELRNTTLSGDLDTSGPVKLNLKSNALNPDQSAVAIAADASGNFFDAGRLKPLGSLKGNARFVINDKLNIAPVTPLLKASGIDLALTGSFRGNAQLVENAGQQTASAQWEITDNPSVSGGLLKGDAIRVRQLSGNFNAALNHDTLDNMKLVLASDKFSATCSGSIKLSELAGSQTLPPVAIEAQANITELKRDAPRLLGSIPDTVVAINLSGALDLAKKTYTVAADSSIREVDPATGRGNTVALAKGDIVSWGEAASNANLAIDYDLERLQGLLKDKLPEGTQIAGRHNLRLHLTGPLTQEAGLRAFRKLNVEKTAVGFDRIYIQGVDLQRGQLAFDMSNGIINILPTSIPANGGSLNPHGRIDLNLPTPAYIHDQAAQRKLGENLAINKEFAATWLQWLPLLWGNQVLGEPGKATQLASVSGLVNLQIDKANIPLDAAGFKQKGALTGSVDVRNLTTEMPLLSDLLTAIGPVAKITQPDLLSIKNGNIQPVAFKLENGRVFYQNLTLGNEKQSIRFSGSVGLDLSLDMNMEVSLAAGATGGGTLGDLARLAGGGSGRGGAAAGGGTLNLAIPVALKGTIRKPELTVSKDALEKTIQNVAPGVIENLLNRGR